MTGRIHLNSARWLTVLACIAFLVSVFAVGMAVVRRGSVQAAEEIWHGLYTDATSYAPGDRIEIYGSAPDVDMVFRLVRLDEDWTEVARTSPMSVASQKSQVGSFIEYPSVSLSGRISFTLEGWLHPTMLGGDLAVVAGQLGMTEAAAGIVILPDGRLAGYVSDTPTREASKLAIAPTPGDWSNWLDAWHHLALTYDGAQVKLYVNGEVAAQRAQTGAVAQVTAPFRLGARSQAPGDLTGVTNGRFDSWALWPMALSTAEIKARRQRGLDEEDPMPDPAEVELYLGFEDAYPSIGDSSSKGHIGVVTNHGNPGVAGVTGEGRAFRTNHDQIVDAGWQVTAELAVPPGTESGMYAIQALLGPDYAPTQQGEQLSARALAIRPAPNGPKAPIAVVLPTNTWLAYNTWPYGYAQYLEGTGLTALSRYPGGPPRPSGNNSAYSEMGDNKSLAYYHGLHRPAKQMSPVKPGPANGEYGIRAPNSMYLVQWLDAQGYDYDVYSDDDFDAGVISAADYEVLMPHGHHEYWSDGMLDTLTKFLDDGGSVVAPAGNIFTWRVVNGPNRVQEVRKFGKAPVLGRADAQSGIDGSYMGGLTAAAICNEGGDYHESKRFLALGVVIHLVKPCREKPFCFGQWAARNASHWLWGGSGLTEDERFGKGREATDPQGRPTFAGGHELDTWEEGLPLPGLAEGQEAVILAVGVDYDPEDPGGRTNRPDLIAGEWPTCDQVLNLPVIDDEGNDASISPPSDDGATFEPTQAGSILYFPHLSGGHVLVIGASATPWALKSDEALSGLLDRALRCFALDVGCGYKVLMPVVLRGR